MTCTRCGSFAINPQSHGRDPRIDLDLCDVCYWRKRAEAAKQLVEALQEIREQLEQHQLFARYDMSIEELDAEGGDVASITWPAIVAHNAIGKAKSAGVDVEVPA